MDNILNQLNQADIAQIPSQSEKHEYTAEESLFHASDAPDCIFLSTQGGDRESYSHQNPVSPESIRNVLSCLADLRAFKDDYARNISLSTVRDVIRMQFNCDGVHIVTAAGFEEFVQQIV